MFEDSPEHAAVYVITPHEQAPKLEELKEAATLSYLRGFGAKELCTRIGSCAVTVCHNTIDSAPGMYRVDEYALDCDTECPLLISAPVYD